MPKSDQEVFEHFQSDYLNSSLEIALLAYARYAQSKYEWMDHEKTRGKVPTEAEIAEWISSLPNPRLTEIHEGASQFFKAAAEDYMKTRMEEECNKAVDRSILSQVKAMADRVTRATSFGRTIGPNVAITVVASFVFALIIAFASVIYQSDPSPFAFLKKAAQANHP